MNVRIALLAQPPLVVLELFMLWLQTMSMLWNVRSLDVPPDASESWPDAYELERERAVAGDRDVRDCPMR